MKTKEEEEEEERGGGERGGREGSSTSHKLSLEQANKTKQNQATQSVNISRKHGLTKRPREENILTDSLFQCTRHSERSRTFHGAEVDGRAPA